MTYDAGAVDALKGFMDPEEGRKLYEIALMASRMGPCLEIGSYCGKSAVYLGTACRENGATLFSIDHHRGSEEHQPGEAYFDPALLDVDAGAVDTFPLFRRTLASAGLEETVVPIVCRSRVVARHWATPLALVFIDGGHAFDTAYADYLCWSGQILPEGYLLIHDIFEDPELGGQAPWKVYQRALASGRFDECDRIKSLGVLKKKRVTKEKSTRWGIKETHGTEELIRANHLIQAKYEEVRRLMAELEAANRELVASKQALEKKQERLIESERKYRNLFENGSDLLCIHDLDGTLLETNLQFKAQYGWKAEDVVGRNIRQLIPEHHYGKLDDYLKRIVANGSDSGHVKGFTKTGTEVILEYRNTLIVDEAGVPTAVQGAARDVTAQIRYERELKESEERYKALVQHIPTGIVEIDLPVPRFTRVNEVVCEYTGCSPRELMEIDPLSLVSKAEDRRKLARAVEKAVAKQSRTLSLELTMTGRDGQTYFILVRSRLFYDKGVPKRALCVAHDLTEIHKAEAARKALEAKLQNVSKLESLGAIAGGVAHDLNNILSGIVSYPDLLLLDLQDDSPLRDPLLRIKKSGQKAAAIVQDLLTLARRNVAVKKAININQIVTDFIATPEYRQIVDDHPDITLRTELADQMLNMLGSEAHLSKSVMNLVMNAVDAMPAGGVLTIATRTCYLDQPHLGFEIVAQGDYAVISVSDTGIGIAESDLSKIFEPFYTKKAIGHSGTGLGMSVVWGTVKDHDGYVDILTAEGSGTTFTLYFPASRSTLHVPSSVFIDDYLGKGETILVVDDAEEQRNLVKQMMERLGYAVATAASGEEAVERIRSTPFDILILDMIMPPGMDGLEAYRKIIEIAPGQKAVIASGYSRTESVRDAQQLGAGPYIKKPFTLERIGLAVRKELDRR